MKKLILSAFMVAVATASVNAQDKKTNNGGGYVRLGFGYAFPFAGSTNFMGTPINGNGTEISSNVFSYEVKNASYGAGFTGVIGGGYMFTPNIGVDVAVGVGIAMKKNVYEETSPASINDYTATQTSYAKMPILVMPSLVFSTGHNSVEGYARVGLALPVAGKQVYETEISTMGITALSQTVEIKNKLTLGAVGAVGVKYHISDMLGLWLEVNGLSMNVAAKSGKVTEATALGINVLSEMETYQREIEFSNEYIENNPNQATTQPFQSGPANTPYSNIGVGVGVSLRF
jgi:outer membrane protein W